MYTYGVTTIKTVVREANSIFLVVNWFEITITVKLKRTNNSFLSFPDMSYPVVFLAQQNMKFGLKTHSKPHMSTETTYLPKYTQN